MAGRDTRTRWQGVFARHQEGCGVDRLPRKPDLRDVANACDCRPSYYGKVYERAGQRYVSTKRQATAAAARGARQDLLRALSSGQVSRRSPVRVRDAWLKFVESAREGRALNKFGRVYKQSAWEDIDECLGKHVVPKLGGRRLGDVHRGDVQQLVDELAPRLSGSRVRSIVNAVRSMYRWAQDRDLVSHDPAARVRLPAMNAKRRSRVATPCEFAELLAALERTDAVPYALAGYATGRRREIQYLRWCDVDLQREVIAWGVEDGACKSAAAQRLVPIVKPLLAILVACPGAGSDGWVAELVCPPRRGAGDGLLHTGGLALRARKAWEARELQPIGLHECRHTAATWMDAAGVSPKVASVLMGHAIPERQPGAADITLARYTHVLPGALENARRQLNGWLEDMHKHRTRSLRGYRHETWP
jgi:integrase